MSQGSVITIVGLGPGDPARQTVEARECLDEASRIVSLTSMHPGLEELAGNPHVETCDGFYEIGSTIDEVYELIADHIVQLALTQDLVFAVPGHPTIGQRSVRLVRSRAAEAGIGIRLIAGISSIDTVAVAIGVDPLSEQVQYIDAQELKRLRAREPYAGGQLTIDPYRPVLVSQISTSEMASAARSCVMGIFPDDHAIIVVRSLAVDGEGPITECALSEIDRHLGDPCVSVWIPPLPPLAATRHWGTLVSIVARLRAPGGCPWDQQQTHESLRSALLDEAYEVVDAIDAGRAGNLAEELGDLLLVVAMHAQLAEEAGLFSVNDALESVTKKLIRRHPHVFGDVEADSAGEVLQNWQAIKAKERADRGEAAASRDPLERLPRSMPVLTKASKLLAAAEPPTLNIDNGSDRGDRLLSLVGEIIAAGDDPEAVLHAALRRHVVASEATNAQAG
jgi:tetrapyrrole methylase family protein/MazG family protein